MKKWFRAVALGGLATLGLLSQVGAQQVASPYTVERPRQPRDVPEFQLTLFNTAAEFDDLSRLNVKVKFYNDALQFIRGKDEKFRADFQVTITLLDQDSSEVDQTSWKAHVSADSYEATQSKRIFHSNIGFIEAPPGNYRYRVGLTDLETRRTGYRIGTVKLRDFSGDRLMISDVWFVDSTLTTESVANGLVEPLPETREVLALFEVYHTPDTVEIRYEIVDQEDKPLVWRAERLPTEGDRLRHAIALSKEVIAQQPKALRIAVYSDTDSTAYVQPLVAEEEQAVPMFTDMRDAILKLEYIADDDLIKKMLEADEEKQLEMFRAFWKPRDPTPETDENEYLEEYYSRINRANKLFRNQGGQGWKSDMGHVYVMLGPPDDVQVYRSRQNLYNPSFTQSTTLVWTYYELRRRVIFNNRFGEYRIGNYSEIFDLLSGEMLF